MLGHRGPRRRVNEALQASKHAYATLNPMSARVVRGLAPAGKPHPTTKWSLLMALLVVVMLGVPNIASAGPPSVSPPQGPMSGGYFNSVYTFNTYISCSGGFSFSSSYSNSLEGTHTFAFWGAADGSLLVAIDGGGLQLITSCGDPLTGPNTNVANYTVTKYTTPPPTPTPTPPPTPTPTPTATPTPGPTSGGGGGGTSGTTPRQTPTPGATASPTPVASPTPSPIAGPGVTASPAPSASATTPPSKPIPAAETVVNDPPPRLLGFAGFAFTALLLVGLILIVLRTRRWRAVIESTGRRAYVRAEPYFFRLRMFLRRRIHLHAKAEPKHPGLSHHRHSGKLIAHHHTSYPALVFLLALSTILAAAVSVTSRADSQLSLTVLGPPPTAAATIDQPLDGEHFTVSTQTVRGTCPLGLMVEMYRNNTFAGSTLCDAGGLYNLLITLVPGQNDLVARDLDGLNQYGPDSATITVYYDVPPPTPTPQPTSTPAPGAVATPPPKAPANPKSAPKPTRLPSPTPTPVPPFYLTSGAHFFQGAGPSVPVHWQIQIHGGTTPYKLTWEWGDGLQDDASAVTIGPVNNSHSYQKPGIYRVVIRAQDTHGRDAVITLLAVVNGPIGSSLTRLEELPGNLVYIWPLLIMASLMVLSFWLGERHKLATASEGG